MYIFTHRCNELGFPLRLSAPYCGGLHFRVFAWRIRGPRVRVFEVAPHRNLSSLKRATWTARQSRIRVLLRATLKVRARGLRLDTHRFGAFLFFLSLCLFEPCPRGKGPPGMLRGLVTHSCYEVYEASRGSAKSITLTRFRQIRARECVAESLRSLGVAHDFCQAIIAPAIVMCKQLALSRCAFLSDKTLLKALSRKQTSSPLEIDPLRSHT